MIKAKTKACTNAKARVKAEIRILALKIAKIRVQLLLLKVFFINLFLLLGKKL